MLVNRAGKTILTMLILLAGTAGGQAAEQGAPKATRTNGIEWNYDLQAAWRAARKHQRPLLVFVTMEGCGYCQKMKQKTFTDWGVRRDVRTRFVPVAIDVKKDAEFVRRLRVRSFPTTVIINVNGDVVDAIPGFQEPREFRQRLWATSRRIAQRSRQQLSG